MSGADALGFSDEVEVFAAIVAEIASGRPRDEALAARGLDDAAFERLSARAEELLSDAADEDSSEAGRVPAALARFDGVLRGATRPSSAAGGLSLEDFARGVVVLQDGGRVDERLAERGLSVAAVLEASARLTPRLARDPELARRFAELLAEARRGRR